MTGALNGINEGSGALHGVVTVVNVLENDGNLHGGTSSLNMDAPLFRDVNVGKNPFR